MNARVGFTRPFQFAFSKLASEYWEAGATVNITGCTMSGSPRKEAANATGSSGKGGGIFVGGRRPRTHGKRRSGRQQNEGAAVRQALTADRINALRPVLLRLGRRLQPSSCRAECTLSFFDKDSVLFF